MKDWTMSHRSLFCGLVALVVSAPGLALAQHHHGHHHHHHGSHFGHGNWSYVVPHNHHHHHHGAYYTANNAYYYTPTPIVRVVSSQPVQIPVVQQPVQIQYGGFARCDDLSGRLETALNELCLDLHYNYQHNAGYAHTYREAYETLQHAKYIHAKEHQGDREAIRGTVGKLDEQFHHVQEELAQWTRQVRRPIGTGEVMQKVSAAEAVMHHLCYDVGIKPHDTEGEQAPPPAGGIEQAPPPAP
jgi:hypothetical protein